MVSPPNREQWTPSSWPVSFRWRLLAALAVLALTSITVFALSRGGEPNSEVSVVAAAQHWPKGHPPGDHATVKMPADLAVLFVHPSDLDGAVAAVDVPQGALVSPQMLRPRQSGDEARTTALLRFTVNAELWPDPGPVAGDQAVFSPSPGGCAIALVSLTAIANDGVGALVTLEATPELAGTLANEQWWIWESPPGGWPACENERDYAVPTPAGEGGVEH